MCATLSTGTLETPSVEVSITEDLTIDQFEHTKLIGHHITFGINSVVVDVSGRTIIAAEVYSILFDRLHQLPETDQVGILKVIRIDFLTFTNAGIELLFNLCCNFRFYKLNAKCHHLSKLAHIFKVGKVFCTSKDRGSRLYELHRVGISPDATIRHCYCITKIALSIIARMRCDDNLLLNYLRELIGDSVGGVFRKSTKPDKIPLINGVCKRKKIKTSVENFCNLTVVVLINFFMRFVDFDLYFVKDTFGAHEEVSSCRIATPDYSGGTINLNAEMTRIYEPIQHGQIARQDRIFGVFEVGVFHSFRIPGFGGSGRFGGQLGNCHTSRQWRLVWFNLISTSSQNSLSSSSLY